MALHDGVHVSLFSTIEMYQKQKLDWNEHETSEECCVSVCLPSCACMLCVFTVFYFILLMSDYFTLIGIFHSSNELYSLPNF